MRKTRVQYLCLALLIGLCVELGLFYTETAHSDIIDGVNDLTTPFTRSDEQRKEIVKELANLMVEYRPNVSPLTEYKSDERPVAGLDWEPKPVFTKKYLQGFLTVDDDHVKEMKAKFEGFLGKLKGEYSWKSIRSRLGYYGDGIVYVGGLGQYNWLALLSITHLRKHDYSQLPVEVILPTYADAEAGFCEKLETLNAKCVILEEYTDHKLEKFQFKGLALLVSSFERILLLDSDNIAAHSPDDLFKKGPFMDEGLVVWPDIWRRATHPSYYDITSVTLGEERVFFGLDDEEEEDLIIPLHDHEGGLNNPTSESGQLLLNKKKNWLTTAMAAYFNIHGPDFYYPLLSQGSIGEGDKETYLAAAVAVDDSYYQVLQQFTSLGHDSEEGYFKGCAMAQVDPIEDYQVVFGLTKKDPRILFVHSNLPRLNPKHLKDNNVLIENDKLIRLYPHYGETELMFGYDYEMYVWKEDIQPLVCDEKITLSAWEGESVENICDFVKKYIRAIDNTTPQHQEPQFLR